MGYNPGYVDGSLIANDAAYVPGVGLSKLIENVGGGVTLWQYVTSDSLGAVLASGYITDATSKRLKVGDIVDVWSGTLTSESTSSPQGLKLGAVTFPASVGLQSLFSSQPSYMRCIVSVVAAATTTSPGAGTLVQVAPVMANLSANFRNLIDGGDFTTNPWQRGTTVSNISGTVVYLADRFFVVATDVTNGTTSAKAAKAAFSSVAGFSQAFRFGRMANASGLSAIVAGQILESNDSIRAQGQAVTLSFYAASEANFSAASSLIGVQVIQGTGTDQGANSAVAGTWTSQSNVVSTTQAITSTMTRYSFTGTVSSAATQLGVLLSYTPTGSAGAADSVLLQGVQLEIGPAMTGFEHRDVEVELALAQRYCFVVNEPASGIGVCLAASTASNKFAMTIALPTPMRAAPTVTVANGSFGFQLANTYLAGSSLAALTAGHIVNAINLTQLATVASNNAAMFVGGGGSGSITASADY